VETVAKYPEVRAAYRRARGNRISQENLAEAVGISRRHMIRIENGEHRPTPELRDRIAAALEIDASALPAVEHPGPFRDAA
jgi:transcriptional regulator with XRE-family HTH domain